jgi:hypothetical protein
LPGLALRGILPGVITLVDLFRGADVFFEEPVHGVDELAARPTNPTT